METLQNYAETNRDLLRRAAAGAECAVPIQGGTTNQPAAPRRKMRPNDCWVIRFREIRKSMKVSR